MLCANLPRLVSDGLINHTDEGLEEDSRLVHWHSDTADLFALLETNAYFSKDGQSSFPIGTRGRAGAAFR